MLIFCRKDRCKYEHPGSQSAFGSGNRFGILQGGRAGGGFQGMYGIHCFSALLEPLVTGSDMHGPVIYCTFVTTWGMSVNNWQTMLFAPCFVMGLLLLVDGISRFIICAILSSPATDSCPQVHLSWRKVLIPIFH